MRKIGVVVGSLRKESYARKIAENVVKLFPEDYEIQFLENGNLPLYNEEYDGNSPEEYESFREVVRTVDAVLFVTPE